MNHPLKQAFRQYAPVALLLAGIAVAALGLPRLAGAGLREDGRRAVLATTYPAYVAAQNILGDSESVHLTVLAGAGAGCLHDYQLSPADRLALDRADAILTTGLGAEPFLDGLGLEAVCYPTAMRAPLLPAAGDMHEPGHTHTDDGGAAAYNEHIWASPAGYAAQVAAVRDALCALVPAERAAYEQNAAAYLSEIEALGASLPDLTGRPCVLFDESLAYLAAQLGLDVRLCLSAGEESGLAAADLAAVERLAGQSDDLILLYDSQYPLRYAAIDGLVSAGQVLALETAVVGQGRATDWLDAMQRNVTKLKELDRLLGGGDAP